MGWINALYETYENCSEMIGRIDDDETVLLPISHSTQNAQIEMTIDINGNFVRAKKVDKEDAVTIIPVTEDSGTRSSGIAPHPLCDKLCYIAGDYSQYCSEKDMKEYFQKYISQLEDWCTSLYSHEKVKAIYKYLKKEHVIADLIEEKVLELDEKNILSDKLNKIQGIAQTDAFVRFIVEKQGERKYTGEVWLDNTLYQSFIEYYKSKGNKKDICYITGNVVVCSDKHPSKIRNSADKAKLISANDESGFTYRGRFTEKGQAASVGYEASQKAHNALRWLIQKQGYKKDGAAIVAWAVNGSDIPEPLADSDDIFHEVIKDADTAKSYAERLNKALSGYSADLDVKTKIQVIALDAATTGRLSITYYRELNGSEFLERIKEWHSQCIWRHRYKKDENGYYSFIGAPSPREIALAAYGTEQNGLLKADEKLIRSTVERLLLCIIDKSRIPPDILRSAVNNAGRPMAMSGYNWQRVLSNTCALIKKYRYDKSNKKEEWDMALDQANKDRSYLFGRLLAVADRVEYLTYEQGEKRETNAKRYMSVFSRRPAKTWKIIYENLIPYLNKMMPGQKIKYENIIDEIGSLFEDGDFNNEPLSELYLLGYYCQSEFMKNKNENKEINGLEDGNDE